VGGKRVSKREVKDVVKRGRRYRQADGKVEHDRKYEVPEAVAVLKQFDVTKFDQTVELAFKLGIDPKQSDQLVRGSVSLPNGTGKKVRVVAFCQGDAIQQAKDAGAVEAGADELVERVQGGWMDFDVALASPDMMPKVGRLGRLLGPKGLMPSPKGGTVTPNIAQGVKEFVGGKIEFRNDAGGNVHVPVGKQSFPAEHLVENVNAMITRIRSLRPSGAKGIYMEKVVLSSTMGPGIELVVDSQPPV
jgi:large subunit ribosomal protein L1